MYSNIGDIMNSYTKTGYAKGRPRKGEIRPPNLNAVFQKKYQHARKNADPEYKIQLAVYQKFWSLMNKERSREIKKNSALRNKAWNGLLR